MGSGRLASLEVGHADAHPKKAHATGTTLRQPEGETEATQQKIKALEAELEHVKAAKKVKSKSPPSEPEPSASQRFCDVLASDLCVNFRATCVDAPTKGRIAGQSTQKGT